MIRDRKYVNQKAKLARFHDKSKDKFNGTKMSMRYLPSPNIKN